MNDMPDSVVSDDVMPDKVTPNNVIPDNAPPVDMDGLFFAAVWNSVDVGMYVTDADRRFVKVNDAYCRLYGYNRTELVGHEFTKVLPESIRKHAAKIHDEFIAGASESAGQWQVMRRDGVIVDVSVTAARVTIGNQTYKVTTVTDITAAKANQEHLEQRVQERTAALTASEKRYRTLLENFPNGSVILFDHELRYILVEGMEWARLGIDPQTMVGKTIYELFDTALIETLEPLYKKALAGEHVRDELEFAGETYNVYFTPIYDDSGAVETGLVTTQRISEQKRAEADAQLFQRLVASATEGIALVNMEGQVTYTNAAYEAMLGYQTGEALGKNANETLSERGQQLLQDAVNDVLSKGQWQGELEHQRRDGQIFETLMTSFMLFDDTGTPTQVASIIRDMSDQRRSERELQASEARLRMIVSNLPVVVFTTDKEGTFTLSEGQGLASLGLAPGQVVGASLFELYGDFPDIVRYTRDALEGNTNTFEIHIPVAEQYFEQYTAPFYDDAGNVAGVLGVAYNITERKRAGAELERTNMRLAKLNELNSHLNAANSSRDVLVSVVDYFDGAGDALLSLFHVETDATNNPEWATLISGYAPEGEPTAMPEGTRLYLPDFPSANVWIDNPHKATFFWDAYRDSRLDANAIGLFQSLGLPTSVFVPLLNQGRWVGLLTLAWKTPQASNDELIAQCFTLPSVLAPVVEVTRLVGELEQTLEDRTRDLRQSQALLRSFFKHAPGLVWVKDLDLRFQMINEYAEVFFDRPTNELVGLTDAEIFTDDKVAEFGGIERQLIANKQAVTLEEETPSSLGVRNLITSKFPIFDDNGELMGIGGFSTDITDLRREIQESRNLMRSVIDNLPSLIFWKDSNLRFLGVNKPLAGFLGFDNPKDIVGKTDFELPFSREQAEAFRADDRAVLAKGEPKLGYEESAIDDKGDISWLRTSKIPLRDEDGNVIAIVGITEDITEQKVAAERLQAYSEQVEASRNLMRLVIDNLPVIVVWKDRESRFLGANKAFASIAGYDDPSQMIGKTDFDTHVSAEQAAAYQTDDHAIMESGQARLGYEETGLDTDGNHTWLRTSKLPLRDERGEIIGVLGLAEDITEQKAASERVQAYSKQVEASRNLMRLVIDNLPSFIFWKDIDLRYMGVNKPFADFAGFDNPEDIIGKTDYDASFTRAQAEAFRADDRATLTQGNPRLNYEESAEDSDGNTSWVRTSKIPLRDEKGKLIGIVGISQDITEQKMAAEHLQAYREQLTKAETELSITKQIQELLIPSESELHRIDHLDIAGFMAPAEQVGGDYYDVLAYGDGLTFSIGDVTGHGLESGLLMLMTQTAVRTLLASGENDPKRFFEVLNMTLYDNLQRMRVDKSLTLSRLDYMKGQTGGQVRLSGQHEHILVVRAHGEVERIDTLMLGLPLGLEASIERHIADHHISLEVGDGVVLYTDGITEAENVEAEQYGLERLCDAVSKYWYHPAQTISEHIVADVTAHIAEHTIFDDMSLVVLKQK